MGGPYGPASLARPNRLNGMDVRQRDAVRLSVAAVENGERLEGGRRLLGIVHRSDAVDHVEPRACNHGAAGRKLLKPPQTAENVGINLQG